MTINATRNGDQVAEADSSTFAQQSLRLLSKLFHSPKLRHRDDFSRVNEIEIYYGTMFGSAEHYARSLAHEITAHRPVRVTIHDLDGFDTSAIFRERLQPTRLFIFVVSTHFAGSPSPSAERFHHWITHLDAQAQDALNIDQDSIEDAPSSTTRPPLSLAVSPRSRRRWLARFRARSRRLVTGSQEPPLKGMLYAVFGIGDSMYLTYNAMGKSVDTRLKELGASRILPVGLGDCSNDLEGSYKAWELSLLHLIPRRKSVSLTHDIKLASMTAVRRLTKLSPAIAPLALTPNDVVSGPLVQFATCDVRHSPASSALTVRDNFGRVVHLRFLCVNLREAGDTVRVVQHASIRSSTPTKTSSFSSRPRTPRIALFDDRPFADIVPVERVGEASSSNVFPSTHAQPRTSGIFKVRLLNDEATYTAVSTLAIFPQNSREHVEAIADAFHFDLDAEIELLVNESRHADAIDLKTEQQQLPFPTPCTIRTALTEFLELCSLTPEFVRVASGFVVSLEDKEVLESLAPADGSTAYRTQIQDQHKGLLDLIAMAPSLRIPWHVFVNIAQPIKPRYFTIASSSRLTPRDLDLAIAFGSSNQPQGLATSFFERILQAQSSTPVPLRGFISVSRFRFRDDGVSPMVFIASGVGFAAMRAIIQERIMLWAQTAPTGSSRTHSASFGQTMPKHLLFLGTANEASIVFLKDLRRWEQQMVVQVHHAYSNDRRYPRRYVQDVVATRMDEIVQTVKNAPGARIFVCGRAAMVRRIREIFEADQRRRGSAWFTSIHKSGRFVEEGYS